MLLVLSAGKAVAGAWPRGEGNAFLSVEHTVSAAREGLSWRGVQAGLEETSGYTSLFAEYGLDEAVTLGLDVGRGDWGDTWTALVFLRRSFATEGPDVWAIEVAMGPSGLPGDETGTVLRPGLHWGRGTGWGWMSAESYVVQRSESEGLALKLDLTAGLRRDDRTSWIARIQSADYPGADPTVRLAPSYVRRVSERTRVELGLLADVAGTDEVGVSVGSWLEF